LFLPVKTIHAGLGILLDVRAFLKSIYRYSYVEQTAKNGVISECEVLADLLESIERFVVNRFKVYVEVTPTPEMNNMLVSFIKELISTLARVTQKLERRRLRGCCLASIILYSVGHSQICEVFLESRTSTRPGRGWTD
jgi:hypothetical protein